MSEVLQKIARMEDIIEKLNIYSESYYKNDRSLVADKEYDELYAELLELEDDLQIIMANSPTQRTEGFLLESLPVVKHVKKMLSSDKTKDVGTIRKFASKRLTYGSWKLDGATLCLSYVGGKLVKAATRGTGEFGEDVTEQAKCIKNIPLTIPYKDVLDIRGECLISWKNFEKINNELVELGKEKYSHPRNLAAGTLRQLNTQIVKDRNLEFIAFECVTDLGNEYKDEDFRMLEMFGFDVVKRVMKDVDEIIDFFDPRLYGYPVDGIMFEYASNSYSRSLGATTKFENCRMALKWKDDVYETVLTGIEWNTSRTGLINPVAIFETVDLDGSMTSRASLHNVSIVKKLKLGIGDTISVYKANKIIPQIYENLTQSDTYEIPKVCPICGARSEIKENDGVETLYCTNKNGCKSKLINKIEHFVSRPCMDIDGLGEVAIEKFVSLGIIKKIEDIYDESIWKDNKKVITELPGFGELSYNNLINSIKKSRNTTLTKFLTALGIPYTGKSTAQRISTYCEGNIDRFIELYYGDFKWDSLKDIGSGTNKAIVKYLDENIELVQLFTRELSFEAEEIEEPTSNKLTNKYFAITGELVKIKRRDLMKLIQEMGGTIIKKISKPKTGEVYLINNNPESESSKNVEAKRIGISIITEEDFYKMLLD